MQLTARRFLFTLAALLLATGIGFAQVPKVGGYYTDKGDLGFKVKVPDDWALIPPQPEDRDTLIAKYVPSGEKYMQLGDKKNLFMTCWLVKFDRRKTEGDEPKKDGIRRFGPAPAKDIVAWMKDSREIDGGKALTIASQKDFTVQKIEATEYEFIGPDDPKNSIGYYAAVYKLTPDVEVGIVFNGQGDPKKWSKWETVFKQMSRSFAKVDTKEIVGGTATGTTHRDKVRAKLNREISTLGDKWKLYETPNYFVLSAHKDKAFIAELMLRLERIREIYEQDYPAAKAEEYRAAGAAATTRDTRTAEEKARDEAEKAFREALNEGVDSKELASCSVVRVLDNQDMYYSYGGPRGTAGYWNPGAKELVVFDDQASGGRGDTWSTMNHEAFHQYIYYFYGAIAPQSWYNEGTGDFYAGYKWETNRYVLKPFQWRIGTIKEAIKDETFVHLKDFVRFTQPEYYAPDTIGQNYAQGWSFIYFLRTGKKANAKGWNPKWDSILETYLRVLAMTGKVDQAVDEAFKEVDYAELEAAWVAYTR